MSFIDTIPGHVRDAVLASFEADGDEHRTYAGDDREFAVWLYVTDRSCRARIGVSIFDLADFCWRDHFDDGATPKEALSAALAAEL